ncbi:hypothetical protein DPMN_110005 [Dreissena polymorpha]|uniref:Uncharacterized protein n=1 Tax=Dreissena polymorpha TaxID=45954 RepID=A0A9D4KBU1_DREPO|nr:hypothetical protein DPMN_110005 [Dreissena polymorpha]
MSDEKFPGGSVVVGDSDTDIDFELLLMPLEFSKELQSYSWVIGISYISVDLLSESQ